LTEGTVKDYISRLSRLIDPAADVGHNGQKKVDIVGLKEVSNNSFDNFLAVFFWPNSVSLKRAFDL
jgi:hypothetical protein